MVATSVSSGSSKGGVNLALEGLNPILSANWTLDFSDINANLVAQTVFSRNLYLASRLPGRNYVIITIVGIQADLYR